MRHAKTEARVQHRMDRLCRRFGTYLDVFERESKFTGPSEYFHLRALRQRRGNGISALLADRLFLEYVYATLASWGMHRMGPGGAKLVPFDKFASSMKAQRQLFKRMGRWSILSVGTPQVEVIWKAMDALQVSETGTKLVANSKVLHHVLPMLIPPIDRQYTLAFFDYWDIGGRDEEIFRYVYPRLQEIAARCRRVIESSVGTHRWHTSPTKVLDNAVVGYVLAELS